MNDEDLTYCDRYDFEILQKDLKTHFGTRLCEFRERKGLSQESLAADVGVERNTISRMELGLVWPKYDNLIAAAERLGVAPADFFDFKEMPQIRKPTPEEALEVLREVIVARRRDSPSPPEPVLTDEERELLDHFRKITEPKYRARAIQGIAGITQDIRQTPRRQKAPGGP